MIAVILYTYAPPSALGAARRNYAFETLRALFAQLRTQRQVWLHIADDGSPQEYRDALWDLAGLYCGDRRSITNSERRGYGGSYNQASWFVHQLPEVEAILQLEDDWALTRPLDLDPLVEVLLTESHRIGMIRLAYLGWIHELRASFIEAGSGKQHYLLLDPESPSEYIFSGGPRLETVAWSRSVGPWPEYQIAGETELIVCGRMAARRGVAWPIDLIPPRGGLFDHIGAHVIKNAPLGLTKPQGEVAKP